MKISKYQIAYNYIVNTDRAIYINLNCIKNSNYLNYLQTKEKKINEIICAICNNDRVSFNCLMKDYEKAYDALKNHQIHNSKSFNLLREKIIQYVQKR